MVLRIRTGQSLESTHLLNISTDKSIYYYTPTDNNMQTALYLLLSL